MIALYDNGLVGFGYDGIFPRRFHQIFPFDYERLIRDAAKFREHVGIMNLIPISKGGAHQFCRRGPGGSFNDGVLAVEKIPGIVRIAGHVRNEARKRCEWGVC